MVPGKYKNPLPPEKAKGRVSIKVDEPPVYVPYSAVPKFQPPDILIPDDFWSNLRQFLFERPVTLRERADAPFTKTSFGSGLADHLVVFLRPRLGYSRLLNSSLTIACG